MLPFYNLFCLNPFTVTDLCGSASKFVSFFVNTFEKVPARVLAVLSDSEFLCFVSSFMQRYDARCNKYKDMSVCVN